MTLSNGALETIRFPVGGMSCASCVNRITRALRGVPGVSRVRVDLGAETVTVTRDQSVVSDAALANAVVGAGYEPDLAAAAVIVDEPRAKRGWLAQFFKR